MLQSLLVAVMLGVDVEKVSPDCRYWSGQTQKSGWLSRAKVWKVVQLCEVVTNFLLSNCASSCAVVLLIDGSFACLSFSAS
jgi:hypothetical protein